jgi:hypothetical protein
MELIADTKVCDLDTPILTQEQVRWLDVPVNDTLVVHYTRESLVCYSITVVLKPLNIKPHFHMQYGIIILFENPKYRLI